MAFEFLNNEVSRSTALVLVPGRVSGGKPVPNQTSGLRNTYDDLEQEEPKVEEEDNVVSCSIELIK